MGWLRHLSKLQREREEQDAEAERVKRYNQTSDDELQKKRDEVESTLESLKREFPDWEIQSDAASSEIRRLEKERQDIILTLSRRRKLGSGAPQSDHGNNLTGKAQQDAPGSRREAFVRPILDTKGFSVHDWATKAGVDFHTADNYLKGKTQPYKSTRKKLAAALGVKVEEMPT